MANFWHNLLLFIEELFGGEKYIQDNPVPAPEPVVEPTPEPPASKQDLITLFCEEIKNMEGWSLGSTSYENRNPGNIRCTPGQKQNWNVLAVGASANNFCIFPSEAAGMQALRNVTVSCAKGLSPTYNAAARGLGLKDSGDLNLYQYFNVRDPASDQNDPRALAIRFGKLLKKDPALFRMKQLLG